MKTKISLAVYGLKPSKLSSSFDFGRDNEWSNNMYNLQKLSIANAGITLITFGSVALAKPAPFSYSITDLSTLVLSDINNKGQVVGVSNSSALLFGRN